MKKLLIPLLIIIAFVIATPATSLARNNHGYYKRGHHRHYNHRPHYRRNYYRPYVYYPRPYGYYAYRPYYRPIYRPYYPVFPGNLFFGIVID